MYIFFRLFKYEDLNILTWELFREKMNLLGRKLSSS